MVYIGVPYMDCLPENVFEALLYNAEEEKNHNSFSQAFRERLELGHLAGAACLLVN